MVVIREIPDGYVLQQVGTSALRNADGTFRPGVPIYVLVSECQADEAEANLIEDAANLFLKMHRKTMEARYEELTGEPAQLPAELQ